MKTNYFLAALYVSIAILATGCGGGGAPGSSGSPGSNPSGLAAPASVSPVAADSQVTVSWPSVTGATGYNIYINNASYVSTTSYVSKTSSATSPATVTGLTNGTLYSVMVTATDSTSESSASPSAQFTPSALPPADVTGFSAIPANKQISVSWAAATGATDYEVTYATDIGFTMNTGTLYSNSTSYIFQGLTNGTTWYYRIRSTNGSVNSNWSSVISATADYQTGWNVADEIDRIGYDAFSSLYTRRDNMNSKRDVLSTWSYSYGVYAATYTKATGWNAAVLLSSSDGLDSDSSLSENGDGMGIWVERIYLDPTQTTWQDEIHARHYVSGVWGSPITLSGAESGQYAYSPTIKVDKYGNAVAVWHGYDGNFYVRTYDKVTDTWTAATSISTVANQYADNVRIDVDSSGVFVLAWPEPTSTSSSTNRIFLRKYSQAGGWQTLETVNTDSASLDAGNGIYSLTVNGNGDIFVLWYHSTSTTVNDVVLRKYSSSTSTWSAPVTVDTSNFAMDRGTVKCDASANAIIYWHKRVNNSGTIVESNNFAVYDATTDTIGPTEQMLMSNYDIYTLDVVSDATQSFRMFYALSGPTHANQRVYNFAAQTWSTPTVIGQYFGNDGYIATSDSAGEILLTTGTSTYDYFTLNMWELVRGTFYFP